MKHLVGHVLSLIDRPGFDAIRARHDYDDGPCGVTKFLNLESWISTNVERAVAIDLHRSSPRRVFDIGTGTGYFPFVCRALGHDVVAIDHPQRGPIFREVCALLGVDVIDHEIRPFEPLPVSGDVTTAFMVTFNGHMATPWGVPEWRYLIDGIRGRIVLELNREPDTGLCYTPELETFFLSRGARFSGHWPHVPMRGGHRVLIG